MKRKWYTLKIEFPVKHIENNLVFSHDGTVWAYYKIDGFNYDFLEDDEKIIPFQQQMSFLTNMGLDLHYLSRSLTQRILKVF